MHKEMSWEKQKNFIAMDKLNKKYVCYIILDHVIMMIVGIKQYWNVRGLWYGEWTNVMTTYPHIELQLHHQNSSI